MIRLRQFLIPWIVWSQSFILVHLQQPRQPTFEDLNASFQNFLQTVHQQHSSSLFHHHFPPHEGLRALQATPMMFLPPHPTLSMPPHMATSPMLMPYMSPNSPLVHSNSQPSTLSSLPLRPAYNVEPSSNPTSVPHPFRRALGAVIREAKDGTLTILSSTAIPTAVAISKVSAVSHSHDLPVASSSVSSPPSMVDVDGTTTNRVDEGGVNASHSPAPTLRKVNIALSSIVSPPTTSVTPRKSTVLPTKETPKASTSGPTAPSTPSATTPASTKTSLIDVTKLTTSQLKLVRSLNSSDLQSFLQSANLTAQDAQVFLKLMEKVLEEEVAKRLQTHSATNVVPTKAPVLVVSETTRKVNDSEVKEVNYEPTISNPESVKLHGEPVPSSEKDEHELKTVDRRLDFDGGDMVEMLATEKTTTERPQPIVLSEKKTQPLREIRITGASNPDVTYKNRVSGSTGASNEDYQVREQAEFDRLLGKLAADQEQLVDKHEDDDLLNSANGQPPVQQGFARINTLPSARSDMASRVAKHRTRTPFERLVQDYEYRLSGQGGINDLVKALRNAHIMLQERNPKRPRRRQPARIH